MKKIVVLMTLTMALLTGCNSSESFETVSELEIQSYPRFTPFETINLPDFVDVTLTNQTIKNIPVSWDVARNQYDANRVGEITITGRFLIQGDENPNDLRPKLVVNLTPVDWLTTLEKNPDYSNFYQAYLASNMPGLLDGGNFTLFAPRNEAFNGILNILGLTFDAFLESDDLDAVVSYHFVEGVYTAQELLLKVPGDLNTFEGSPILMDFNDQYLTLNVLNRVVRTNEPNTDVSMHQIDGVLIPPGIAANNLGDILTDQTFNLLTQVLGDIGIDPISLLRTGFTAFLPNQAAFEALAEDRGLSLQDLLAEQDIGDILANHIVLEELSAEDLYIKAPMTLTTLNGSLITVEVVDDQLQINGIVLESSQDTGQFGIIHIIEGVILQDE
jgi:uncharacterized surface protein with fasciclin (FAS1) repeats